MISEYAPDVTHGEQMSIVLRFVECITKVDIRIREVFFGFLNVNDSIGKSLMGSFIEMSHRFNLNIADLRGRLYDNGANM